MEIPFLNLDKPGERDVTLADDSSFWVTVGDHSVWIVPDSRGGVFAGIYHKGDETGDPVEAAMAHGRRK